MTHDVDVLVIGAGMSGIGLAIQLIRQHKTRSFELIEKSESVAGTWWVNSYPGCGCDVSQPSAVTGFILMGQTGAISLLLILFRVEPEPFSEIRLTARDLSMFHRRGRQV